MGLVDTADGIRFSPGALSTAVGSAISPESKNRPCDSLVEPSDSELATEYSFLLMSQMKPCTFTESDRLGKRRSHRVGFPGIACVHCFGVNGSGRHFPSSVKTFADVSKTMNVLHNHLIRCKCCPDQIKADLQSLKESHTTEKEAKKFGSQKSFFDIIWSRLHHTSGSPSSSSSSRGCRRGETKDDSPDSFNSWVTEAGEGSTIDGEVRSAKRAYLSPNGVTTPGVNGHPDPSINDIALIMTSLSKTPVVWEDPCKGATNVHQV